MTAETSQTLDRGLRVLKLLADTDHGLTVTELASKLGVNRTVVYRLLATLEQHALVRRDIGGRARVGLGVLRLAHQVHPLLREAAMPVLRSLAEEIGATAHLTLVDGNEALAVAVVEPSWTDYHVAYRTGFRHPLDRGAAGRAILEGRLRTGETLPTETDLASKFGVTRHTVREGIRVLEQTGFVKREAGRRLFVSLPRHDELAPRSSRALLMQKVTFRELWEVALQLEVCAADLAAARNSRKLVDALRRCYNARMNMSLKIIKVGNSSAVILPKELMAKLRVGQGDVLFATESPDGVRLSAADPDFEEDDWSTR